MKMSSHPRRASSRRMESPSSRGFLEVLLLALELLLPTCSGACDESPRYQSMKIKGAPKPPYRAGHKIEYECRPGYKRIVPALPVEAECQADGTWAPALQEACTRKTCQQIGEPANGEVIYANGTMEFGSQAHFTCHDGYYLLGPKILYCELSGNSVEWSDNLPACERILCKPPAKIPNGDFTGSYKVAFEYHEIVIYSCKPSSGPDEYSLVGERQLTCVGRDKWSGEPPECKVVKCNFPVVQNGRVVSGFGRKFLYKAEVKFECNAGFQLEGSDTIVCGADNTWKPEIPKCIVQGATTKASTTTTSTSGTTTKASSTRSSSSGTTTKASSTRSSSSGHKPTRTVPTKTTKTTKRRPVQTTPDDDIPAKVNNLVLAVAVIGTCLYKFLHVRKRQE